MLKVLVLCGDYWHPAEIVKLGMKPLEDQFSITYIQDAKDTLTIEFIKSFQIIVCCKGNHINEANSNEWFEENVTEVMPEDFREWVGEGHGLLFVHAGNTYKKGEGLSELSGNYFIGHPPRCEMRVELLEHPVTEGIENFTIRDEQCQIEVTENDAEIFLKTYSRQGGEQTGGYTRFIGAGRICILTPGHIWDVWHRQEYMLLIKNAIEWCGGMR